MVERQRRPGRRGIVGDMRRTEARCGSRFVVGLAWHVPGAMVFAAAVRRIPGAVRADKTRF